MPRHVPEQKMLAAQEIRSATHQVFKLTFIISCVCSQDHAIYLRRAEFATGNLTVEAVDNVLVVLWFPYPVTAPELQHEGPGMGRKV